MQKRNPYFDIVKYAAMFLVLWGHVIQQTCMLQNPSNDIVYCLIYTIHMPIFMGICGYFLSASINNLSIKKYILIKLSNRIIALIMPMLTFGTLKLLVSIFFIGNTYNNIFNLIIAYIKCVYNIWFLGALAINTIIIIVTSLFCSGDFKYDIKYFLFSIPCSIIVYGGNGGIFMYLFFFTGYCMHKYGINKINSNIIYIAVPVYALCFYLFENMPCEPNLFTINYHKFSLMEILNIDILKIFLGFSGSYIFMRVIYKMMSYGGGGWLYNMALKRGRYTLEIYLIQIVFLEMIMGSIYQNYVRSTGVNPLYMYGIITEVIATFIVAAIIMEIIIVIVKIINRIGLLKKILFYR